MKLAFACPYYGPTPPTVGFSQRANIMNAAATGHEWVDDYSSNGMQHREACQAMAARAVEDDRIDAVVWTEHDVILPPNAVERMAEVLRDIPEADIVTGFVFRRSPPYTPMVCNLEQITEERYERMKTSRSQKYRELATELTLDEMRERLFTTVSVIDPNMAPYRVDTASLGCLLIRRSALQAVAHMPDLFAAERHLSIDNQFFRHCCQKAGLSLYCVPDLLCGHLADPKVVTWTDWRDEAEEIQRKVNEMRAKAAKDPIEFALMTVGARGFRAIQQEREILDCARWLTSRGPLGRVIEIGVCHGGTAALWSELGGKVLAVDFPDGDFGGIGEKAASQRDKRMKGFYPSYQCVRGNSQDEATLVEVQRVLAGEPVDLLFIDADHSYKGVKRDYELYRGLVRPGGVILFHDIEDTPVHRESGAFVFELWREIEGTKREFTIHGEWGGLGAVEVA